MGENIKVAVRVRPFSEREKKRQAKLIVSMTGGTTAVVDPDNPKAKPKKFTYDYSFWSHDGYQVDASGYHEPKNPLYVDQKRLFSEVGENMLKNAWQGYNCSIFAYGQTGSGKSYSIMGHGPNKGIVPRTCEELFKGIEAKRGSSGINYAVTFSMMEIYNEHARDLLGKAKSKTTLQIKESPGRGFYAEGLTVVPVGSYNEIRIRMNEGDRQRTIAATKMNETSSRAHTIVTLNFAQNSIREKMTKHSIINLVDLAGSERAKQTEATGDRFEESKNINKSLLTLGNVIKGLCEKAKGKTAHIQYRDSLLTKLLKNALGGNSKTLMIAAISPDAENYEQTLSTLRYADKAKSIKTSAQVNETATNKLIKDLISEKERLLKELQDAKSAANQGFTEEEIQRLKEEQEREIEQYREQMTDIESSWQKRLKQAQQEMQEMRDRESREQEKEKSIPHLSNLNEDPALCGKIIHLISTGSSEAGNGKDGSNPEIKLNGPRIAQKHCLLSNKDSRVTLKPRDGLVLHNGQELKEEKVLEHLDRLRFGSNNFFVFIDPAQIEAMKRKGRSLADITYESALSEITSHAGFNIENEEVFLQQDVQSLMQLVQDVNAMAEDMNKQVDLSIVLVSAEARGLEYGRTEVFVKMDDLTNGNEFLWSKDKFLVRQSHMQEMYSEFEATGSAEVSRQEDDPFWEPVDTPVLVGVVTAPLTFLSHGLAFQNETLTVIDYKAQQIAFLQVDVVPCDGKGKEKEFCVNDPLDLVNKSLSFKVKIAQAMNLPARYDKTWCRYRFYTQSNFTETDKRQGANPVYNHSRQVNLTAAQVDHKLLGFMKEQSLVIEVWGSQRESFSATTINRREDRQKLISEADKWRQKAENLQQQLNDIRRVLSSKQKSDDKLKKIKGIVNR